METLIIPLYDKNARVALGSHIYDVKVSFDKYVLEFGPYRITISRKIQFTESGMVEFHITNGKKVKVLRYSVRDVALFGPNKLLLNWVA